MKKKFLSILLALAMCLSLLPTMALAVAGVYYYVDGDKGKDSYGEAVGYLSDENLDCPHYVGDSEHPFKTIAAAIENAPHGTIITLLSDITVTNDITIESDDNIDLDLNGHVLKSTGSGSVITVEVDGILWVWDSSPTVAQTIAAAPWAVGGVITGGNTGVIVKAGGIFRMYGGTITGNTVGVTVEPTYGGVTLGGTAKITGNAKSNLYLPDGATVDIDDAKPGMVIGVTMADNTDPITVGVGSAARYFASDAAGYTAVKDGDVVRLVAFENDKVAVNVDTRGDGSAIQWYTDLQEAIDAVEDETNDCIRLLNNVEENIKIDSEDDITLDLNGHVLNWKYTLASVVRIDGGNLTLIDTNPTAKHDGYLDTTGLWKPGTAQSGKTKYDILGGVITGGGQGGNGGGVYVNSGAFTMNGGNISGNTALALGGIECNGGGVYVNNGAFTMNGGSITGNTAKDGGGVYVNNSFTMHGGTISGNTADNDGGGVCISEDGTMTMLGGAITGNKATENGGGVNQNGTFNMTGGSITSNTANSNGGGVYDNDGDLTLGGTAKITGNTVGSTANNLYMPDGKYVTIGTPENGMSVGVTTATTPEENAPVAFTGETDEGNAKYFFSDNTDYYVERKNGALELTVTDLEDKYQVWVAGTQITAHNKGDVLHDGGTVSYTPDAENPDTKGTLTLNGATIAMTGQATGHDNRNASGVKSGLDKLIVSIKGTNTIGAYSGTDMAGEDNDGSEGTIHKFTVDAGVYCAGEDVSFVAEENSRLTIIDYGAGIQAKNVTFGSNFKGTLKVLDFGGSLPQPPKCAISATGNVTINGGKFDLVSETSNGISADDVTITGGTVNLISYTSDGIHADGTVSITGGEHTFDCYNGIVLQNVNKKVNVTGGKLTVTAQNYALAPNLTLGENMVMKAGADATSAVKMTAESYNQLTDFDSTSDNNYVLIQPKEPTPPSSGGGSSTPTVTVPVSGDKDSVKVTATVSGGNATVKNVTSEQLDKVGTGENVTIDLSSLSKSVSGVTIPKTTFENVAASDADGLEVKLPNGTTAVFDSATVAAVAEQAAGSNIQLVVDKENKAEQALTAAQKETVKALNDALVLDAYFVSNGKRISDFKGGEAELTVSYPTTKPVRVWYVAEDGTKELVPSTFDGKSAKFVVTHFSHYAIEILDGSSYAACPQDNTCVYAKFTDANTAAWYHDGVHYCVENGMMNGVSNTQFAPNGTLTRGMVVTVLARLDGVTITSTGSEWYADGQAWAVKNGISDGTNMTGNITREQLATMLYRYAQFKGVDTNKFTENTNTLSHNDVFTISDWATSGMHFCIAAGVVNGDDKGNLNPHSTATRAEAATMFQRFSEKVIK